MGQGKQPVAPRHQMVSRYLALLNCSCSICWILVFFVVAGQRKRMRDFPFVRSFVRLSARSGGLLLEDVQDVVTHLRSLGISSEPNRWSGSRWEREFA